SIPVPVEQVGRLMRDRAWQYRPELAASLPPADIAEADGACDNLITLRAHMLVRHQFGSDVDWHLRLFDDIESTVSLNAQPFIRNLAVAYAQTGNDDYARHCARLLWSFYRQAPLPNHHQPFGPWRTLEVGNRQCNAWPVVVACAGQTDAFDEQTHAMLARSRLDHMRYALAYCGGANNWYQVEAAGLATAALFSPELRHADAYLRVALRRLRWINSFAYYDDGFQFELTPGYHVFPTSSMFAVVASARARGVALPDDFVSLVEKAHEMYLYAVQPDHILPMLNDCNPNPTDPAPLLQRAAQTFESDAFRWGGSHGQEGRAPDQPSHAWSSAGYYVMRDKWGEDGQYLFFDGAPWGASHQHEDKLNFVLYAYGRLLIGDPNIYSYSRTELTHYFRSSRAHNVVLIDGQGQARRARQESRLSTLGRNEWVSAERFDFVSSEYLEGFAQDLFGGVTTEADERFRQRRAIFYVKPGYWILCDLIRGQDQETHTLEQLFHVAPLYKPGETTVFEAGELSVSPSVILTRDRGQGNLAILPVDARELQVRAQKGETNPAVGWYGVLGEFPAWDVTLERKKTCPARMDVVLFPMPPGSEAYPAVQRLAAGEWVTAFRITGEGLDDTFVLCEEGCGVVTIGDLRFEGRALLLRRQPELQVLTVNPVTVLLDGRTIG
ncbi:MAG: alginate lyase family protein, partial [Anaerolineae bacterium]|nr:alginate lyase family protein [Anaerolineae bacterium]